jgi:hypothetical protein
LRTLRAATWRILEDNDGQQETTNLEVSSGFTAIQLGRETGGPRFQTAEVTESGETLLHHHQGRPCGRPPAALRPGNDTTLTGEPASPSTPCELEQPEVAGQIETWAFSSDTRGSGSLVEGGLSPYIELPGEAATAPPELPKSHE